MIVTRQFTTSSGDYFAILISEWTPRYGWTLLLPLLATAALGCVLHDVRWVLVALMLLFIVIPMAMSFLYTYYMLTPEARRAVLCKRVEIEEGECVKLIYERPRRDNEDEAVNATAEDTDADAPLPPAETLPWSDVKRVRRTSRFLVYFLKGERMQFLLVPLESIEVMTAS